MSTKTSVLEKNPSLADISIEEIQELLAEKQKAANEHALAKRKNYEERREALINDLGGFAVSLRGQMLDLKLEAFRDLAKFREEMLAYGEIKGGEKNKGSFQLKNDNYKIEFSSQVNKCFDERAELAEVKLKEFLSTFVKKKDKNAYTMIMALLERTKGGEFDINLINRLYAIEDQFDNPLWKEAIRLFKESYSPYGTAQYIKFSVKNPTTNGYDAIVLDFAKLKSATYETTDEEGQEGMIYI